LIPSTPSTTSTTLGVIMVIDRPHDGATVFEVFATRARRRSRRSLVNQTVACTVTGVLVLLLNLSWWPVATALAAGACYAAWGLLDREARSRFTDPALRVLAIIAAILAITAVVGVGLAAFTGDGRSPYGTCYDASGRAFACDARGQRRP
jgi:hypothetical protein